MKRAILSIAIAALAMTLLAAGPPVVVSGQLLAYQDGYVFFTTGDGFRVAHDIVLRDAKTGAASSIRPAPRVWARATFDPSGTVTELDLSRSPLPPEGSFDDVSRFAVALSTPVPNPDLLRNVVTPEPNDLGGPSSVASIVQFSGKPVLVTFIVQVPPNTPFTSSVYITNDVSGWNAQAIPMDRVDALHYQITRRYNSGTIFRYLYDRGTFQSQESAQNGLQRPPRQLIITNADVRVIRDTVYAWQDSVAGGVQQVQPQIMPTPYNPAPFPNLPPCLPPPEPGGHSRPPSNCPQPPQ
ncbi:MAG: hypothetical protein JOZ77_09440 [Candidatus Eremiobacteraeota bacterium]|nr:hypothetical protein [Candidatus Eremiobacteraeota bacterium]